MIADSFDELIYFLTWQCRSEPNVIIGKLHISEAKRTWLWKKLGNSEAKQACYALKLGNIEAKKWH